MAVGAGWSVAFGLAPFGSIVVAFFPMDAAWGVGIVVGTFALQ